MANLITVTVLQKNQYPTATGGVVSAIPATGIVVTPYTGTVNGVTAHATVTIPPTGLNQRATELIVTSTVAQVVTAANAALA